MDIALDALKELVASLDAPGFQGQVIHALTKAYPTFEFHVDFNDKLGVVRRPKQELRTDSIAPKMGKTDVVPALLRYLDEAQKGNVAEIAIACLWTDNQYGFTVSSARLEMLGCVDHMKHAMITSVE
jgi:hypothetical protein